jgi:hypothetical protein
MSNQEQRNGMLPELPELPACGLPGHCGKEVPRYAMCSLCASLDRLGLTREQYNAARDQLEAAPEDRSKPPPGFEVTIDRVFWSWRLGYTASSRRLDKERGIFDTEAQAIADAWAFRDAVLGGGA